MHGERVFKLSVMHLKTIKQNPGNTVEDNQVVLFFFMAKQLAAVVQYMSPSSLEVENDGFLNNNE